MKLAIRADGGPEIGYGHLVRTGSVAHEFLKQGHDVVYLTRTPKAVEQGVYDDVDTVSINAEKDLIETTAAIQNQSIDVVLTDFFGADTRYQKELADTGAKVAVRHNYRRETVCCDVLFYGEIEAPELEYSWVDSKPELCLGPDFILLREQFRSLRETSAQFRSTPERALIVMGGSDVHNLTPGVMRAFAGFDGLVDVVIGPGFENEDHIIAAAESSDVRFELQRSPNNMASLMISADLAVTAVGGTVYELLATQTPFVGVPVVENQQSRAAALDRRDLALVADDIDEISDQISTLAEDTDSRRELYDRSLGMVDGEGPRRVFEAIQGP